MYWVSWFFEFQVGPLSFKPKDSLRSRTGVQLSIKMLDGAEKIGHNLRRWSAHEIEVS